MTYQVSIALFGSTARGDTDELSDRDILVVYEQDRPEVSELEDKFGFNAEFSFYTRTQLETLAKTGSLFIAHLKLEAILLVDDDEWLRRCVDSFVPKKSYLDDAKNSTNVLDILERFNLCDEVSSFSSIADIAYITFRNHMIFQAANRGEYIFAYRDLVDFALEANHVTSNPRRFFDAIRLGRHYYQLHQFVSEVDISVADIYRGFQEIGISRFHDFKPVKEPIRVNRDKFFALRDFEASVSKYLGYRPTSFEANSSKIRRLWQSIDSGRGYLEHQLEHPLVLLKGWSPSEFEIGR